MFDSIESEQNHLGPDYDNLQGYLVNSLMSSLRFAYMAEKILY